MAAVMADIRRIPVSGTIADRGKDRGFLTVLGD